jgi:hypothetical protein
MKWVDIAVELVVFSLRVLEVMFWNNETENGYSEAIPVTPQRLETNHDDDFFRHSFQFAGH